MRHHGNLEHNAEVNEAAWEAARGAAIGAARWGLYSGIIGIGAYLYSPLYRGFTIQFKVFLQMSGMTVGSMIEADRRLRTFEASMRRRKRIERDTKLWRQFENDFENRGTPGVGSEGSVHREE